jgi:signal transduction histidine kinase
VTRAETTPASGLKRKLWLLFLLQVLLISVATVLGVYGASAVLKQVLIQRALTDEAGHYWQRLAADPDAALPDTYNMQGYLLRHGEPDSVLPAALRALPPGYHSLPQAQGGALILVDQRPQGRLYLEFKQEQVDALAFYFGAVPLVLVLLVIYLIAWAIYRMSRRAISPVSWLAGVVQRWDPKRPDVGELTPSRLPLDVEGEVLVLATALHEFACRIARLVERERQFTRDASHELRTPLTVIRMACDVMLADGDLSPHAERSLGRIQSAARDMEALIESFLMLARETESGLPEEDFLVNDIVREELDRAEPLLADKPVELRLIEPQRIALHAPSRALAVVLSNLIRNACIYTERGHVTVRIGADFVRIEDSGPGIAADELAHVFEPFFRGGERRGGGHGVGLSIVQRLSERFGWPLQLESEPGRGTVATLRFPAAKAQRPGLGTRDPGLGEASGAVAGR